MRKLGWILPFVAMGCSSNSGGSGGNAAGAEFAQQFCSKLTNCGQSVTNCDAEFAAIVLSSSCQSLLLSASCADLSSSTSSAPASVSACFPPCSTTTNTCSGDETVSECVNGTTFVFDCAGVCSSQSKTYTGTCSATYNGQSATNGAGCWCK